jgi:hypothetical protein
MSLGAREGGVPDEWRLSRRVVDLLNRVYEGATDPKRTLLSVSCADPVLALNKAVDRANDLKTSWMVGYPAKLGKKYCCLSGLAGKPAQ